MTSTAYKAVPGDELVIRRHVVGGHEATGEILEVLGEPGHEHYRVRWDDGHESIHYPGGDAYIRPLGKRRPARKR